MNRTIVTGTLEIEGYLDVTKRVYDPQGICPTLTTMRGGHLQPKVREREREKVIAA